MISGCSPTSVAVTSSPSRTSDRSALSPSSAAAPGALHPKMATSYDRWTCAVPAFFRGRHVGAPVRCLTGIGTWASSSVEDPAAAEHRCEWLHPGELLRLECKRVTLQ